MRKELYLPFFEGKKITVMGVGVLGRGLGDISFLAACGGEIIATDKKSEEDLKETINELKKFSNVSFRLNEHKLDDFGNKDFILKAAGVPFNSEFIFHAKNNNIPVYMSAALLVKIIKEKLNNVTVIGITGTRGKSTVTHLINHILVSSGEKVHLGGNVRGVANLPLLEKIQDGEFLVLELDSWQLQGFGDLKISPDIAVFTSFLDDHLNYYGGDRELYFKDKANIFSFQKETDACVVSKQAKEEIDKRNVNGNFVVVDSIDGNFNLIGKHNRVAISLAVEVAKLCNVEENEAIKSAALFKAVAGRLEYVGEFSNKKVFNDNNATTPDATIVAVKSIFAEFNKRPIVIIGGADKNLNLDKLEETLKNFSNEVVYLSGTGTDKISLEKKYEFEKLEDCIDKAFDLSVAGDIILFSPAFASFSKYFRNEYEKNDFFVNYINKYKN